MAPLTDYEKYIRTEELLALQKRPEQLSCHDEMQFQIIHQAAELWMKLVEHEVDRLVFELGEDRLSAASLRLTRIATIMRLLVHQMDLLDTLAPKDYMTIRTVLGNGSGQESPGFKALLRPPGEKMWPALSGLLERRGTALRDVYEQHEVHHELFRLCEGFTDYDQLLQMWRHRHLMMVFRIIGAGTPSLKGKASELLERGMKTRFFPPLWEVRDEVFADWTRQMLAKGKDTGYHG